MSKFINIDSPVIPPSEDSYFVSHVYWSKTRGIVDTKGFQFRMAGTATINNSGVYDGVPTYTGPASASNYWFYNTLSDFADSTGDRFGVAVFVPPNPVGGVYHIIHSNGTAGVAGHGTSITPAGVFEFFSAVPGTQTATTTNLVVAGQVNVATWWRTGNNIAAQLNAGPTKITAAGAAEVSGTGYSMKFGVSDANSQPFLGGLIEIAQGLGSPPGGPAAWSNRISRYVLERCGQANAWIGA